MCGLALVLVAAWSGVSQAAPAPITDYANYPPPLPAGCTADGPSVLTGVQFAANGRTAASLRDLNLVGGDTVTMTWTGFAPGCEGVGIGLSFKIAQAPTFVVSDNQYLQSFDYCGPDGTPCSAPFTLTLTLPTATSVPCGQLDAHIGRPLAIVGPSGAYYNLNNPVNMLISAFNGGGGDCTVPPCPTNPSVPAGSMLCEAQTTTTTTAPTTTTTVPPTTQTTSGEVCATNPSLPANSPQCQPTTSTTSAPVCATNPNLPAGSPLCAPSTENTSGQVCATNPAILATSAACQPATSSSAVSTCPAGQQMDAVTGTCVATSVLAARVSGLPFTGSNTRPALLLAGLLMLVGAPLALVFRRRPGKHYAN
jgi:LPXTG-motif cell wall-anchored protein